MSSRAVLQAHAAGRRHPALFQVAVYLIVLSAIVLLAIGSGWG